MSKCTLTAVLVVALAGASAAGTIVVDGNLLDWGITVGDGNTSTINGYSGKTGIGLLGWHSEDQNDNSNSHGLGPNAGGQNYDAEWMGVAQKDGRLYIAIVTGQRPDNGKSTFGPGDIRIVTDLHVFGIEVGGGEGGSGITGYLVTSGDGATYVLQSGNGKTLSVIPLSGSATPPEDQTAGSIWRDKGWIDDPIVPKGPTQLDHDSLLGTNIGDADYVYTRNDATPNYVGSQHAIIELSVPLSMLGLASGGDVSVHWRPGCGNDELDVCAVCSPEPGSAALIGLGALAFGVGCLRRRSRKTA